MANEGQCGTCGFLSKRTVPDGAYRSRPHMGFHEVEQIERQNPAVTFPFVPGETNAWQRGEFACFRHAADLPREMREAMASEQLDEQGAAHKILWKDRSCAQWCEYEPGISPTGHFMDLKARRLEQDRQEFQRNMHNLEVRQHAREQRAERRLTKAAIILGAMIGIAQIFASIITMSKDSIGLEWMRSIYSAFVKQHPESAGPTHDAGP